jgi:hypothetical protein
LLSHFKIQVSGLCLNEVTLELGIMVGGLIFSCDVFFVVLHLIGERLNASYRRKLQAESGDCLESGKQESIL